MASLRNLGAHLGWTAPDDLRHTPNAAPCRLSGSREELRELGLLPEIGAVVLTINGGGGGSYDQLFSQVQQKGPDGTAVAVYEANYEALGLTAAALADPEQADALASNSDLDARVAGLVADVHSLSDAASFVLNFECCGCCSEGGFAGTPDIKAGMWKAIDLCLKRGSFVMASDFSLKAIIKDWDRQILGPKPFVQLSGTVGGGCNNSIDLAFDSAELIACPSAQLNAVGQLCGEGKASSHAMGGTITYAVDEAGAAASRAAGCRLEVLTVAEKVDGMVTATNGMYRRRLSKAGGVMGLAGHVLITYPSGGKLLTSMGHWIELSKLHGCTEESVLRTAESRGAGYVCKLRAELDACSDASDRSRLLQEYAAELVQSSAPCMVRNNAGGESFAVDDQTQLLRFLILGSSEGTYYTKPAELTAANLAALTRMMEAGEGTRAVEIIKAVSKGGRAARQTPTLLALAMCCQLGDAATKTAAYKVLSEVLRIPTHLFEFLELSESTAKTKPRGGSSGWGRAHRRAIARWYNEYRGSSAPALAEAVTKYQKRHGWSHLDALRLCHAAPSTAAHGVIFRYLAKGLEAARSVEEATTPPKAAGKKRPLADASDPAQSAAVLGYLDAVEEAKALASSPEGEARMAELIGSHRLVREHVPSTLLHSVSVWTALLETMPLGAMVRSLSKLTSIGLLTPGSEAAAKVVARLTDAGLVKKARLHPLSVLIAHRQYSAGTGDKGSLMWDPVPEVLTALETTFVHAFASVTPAGKRICVAVDISESMSAPISGGSLTCAEAAAAMSLLIAKTEPACAVMAFAETFVPLPIDGEMGLHEAVNASAELLKTVRPGGTDCSLPMQWAISEHAKDPSTAYECFVVFTDNETWSGEISPHDALARYRKAAGVDAKLVVVGMASNGFTVADPTDPGMLDIVGMDASAPQVMSDVAAGRV